MATTTTSPRPAASPPAHRRSPWTVLGVMCLGLFMVLLDTTIVNVALPQLMEQLGATLNEAFWVFSAYVLGFATLLITAGRLGDTYGPRRVYLVGLTVFVVGSALAGLAQQPGQLIGARVVQGVGAALLTPQLLPVVTMVFRPARWGSAFGFIGALSGIAVLVGPTLGGVVVTTLGWRWIFFLNLPVGLVGFLLVRRLVHDYRPGLTQRLGLGQVAVLTGGLGCVTYGLIEGQRFDWPIWIFALIGLGLLLAGAFAVLQQVQQVPQRQQRRSPLVPVDLLRARNYALMVAVAAAVGFAMLGAFLPLTIYLQAILDMTPLRAGLTIAVMPLAAALVAGVSGRLADAYGGKYPLFAGLLSMAAGLGYLARVAQPDSGAGQLMIGLGLAGLGMGMTFAPMYSVAMKHVRSVQAGVASGLLNTAQELGGLLAGAAVGAMLQSRLAAALLADANRAARALPASEREEFLASVGSATGPLRVTSQAAGGRYPELAASILRESYTSAMRPALLLPVAALLLGAVACLLVHGRSTDRTASSDLEYEKRGVAR